MSELKPCPFCGGEAHITLEQAMWFIECENEDCGAMMGFEAEVVSRIEAIAAWNSRTGKDINVPTNADRIRGMSDEEMAKWMLNWVECDNDGYMCTAKRYKNSKRCDGHCVENHLDWLQRPAEE